MPKHKKNKKKSKSKKAASKRANVYLNNADNNSNCKSSTNKFKNNRTHLSKDEQILQKIRKQKQQLINDKTQYHLNNSRNNNNNKQKKNKNKRRNRNNNNKNKNRNKSGSNWKQFLQQLRPLGLEIRNAQSDGNCLFRAISDQLTGNQSAHAQYRLEIVRYLAQHSEAFAPFYIGNFNAYVAKMRADGEWGGNMELIACSKLYRLDIVIHQLSEARYEILYQLGGKPVRNIHISYHDGKHYASVRRCDDTSTKAPAKAIDLDGDDPQKALDREAMRDQIAWCNSGGTPLNYQRSAGVNSITSDERRIMNATFCSNVEHIRQVLRWNDNDIQSTVECLLAEKANDPSSEEEEEEDEDVDEHKDENKEDMEHDTDDDNGHGNETGNGTDNDHASDMVMVMDMDMVDSGADNAARICVETESTKADETDIPIQTNMEDTKTDIESIGDEHKHQKAKNPNKPKKPKKHKMRCPFANCSFKSRYLFKFLSHYRRRHSKSNADEHDERKTIDEEDVKDTREHTHNPTATIICTICLKENDAQLKQCEYCTACLQEDEPHNGSANTNHDDNGNGNDTLMHAQPMDSVCVAAEHKTVAIVAENDEDRDQQQTANVCPPILSNPSNPSNPISIPITTAVLPILSGIGSAGVNANVMTDDVNNNNNNTNHNEEQAHEEQVEEEEEKHVVLNTNSNHNHVNNIGCVNDSDDEVLGMEYGGLYGITPGNNDNSNCEASSTVIAPTAHIIPNYPIVSTSTSTSTSTTITTAVALSSKTEPEPEPECKSELNSNPKPKPKPNNQKFESLEHRNHGRLFCSNNDIRHVLQHIPNDIFHEHNHNNNNDDINNNTNPQNAVIMLNNDNRRHNNNNNNNNPFSYATAIKVAEEKPVLPPPQKQKKKRKKQKQKRKSKFENWFCADCQTLNGCSQIHCSMCGSTKPSKQQLQSQQQIRLQKSSKHIHTKWNCAVCTFRNAAKNMKCAMCDNARVDNNADTAYHPPSNTAHTHTHTKTHTTVMDAETEYAQEVPRFQETQSGEIVDLEPWKDFANKNKRHNNKGTNDGWPRPTVAARDGHADDNNHDILPKGKCHCGSGRKYRKCHGRKVHSLPAEELLAAAMNSNRNGYHFEDDGDSDDDDNPYRNNPHDMTLLDIGTLKGVNKRKLRKIQVELNALKQLTQSKMKHEQRMQAKQNGNQRNRKHHNNNNNNVNQNANKSGHVIAI